MSGGFDEGQAFLIKYFFKNLKDHCFETVKVKDSLEPAIM